MKLILLSLLFVTKSALALDTLEMDRPIHFETVPDIHTLASKPAPRELDASFGEAMTYIVTYADVDSNSGRLSDTLLLTLVQDRSPRQIMILGFALRLELMKKAVAQDELRIADKELLPKETFEQSKKLYELRLAQGRGNMAYLKQQIDRLLDSSPNHSPEGAAGAVH